MLKLIIVKKRVPLLLGLLLCLIADAWAVPRTRATAPRAPAFLTASDPALPATEIGRSHHGADNSSAEHDRRDLQVHGLKGVHPRFCFRLPRLRATKTIEEAPSIAYTSRLAEQAVFPRSPPMSS